MCVLDELRDVCVCVCVRVCVRVCVCLPLVYQHNLAAHVMC